MGWVTTTTLLWMICAAAGMVAGAAGEDSRTQDILIGLSAIAGGLGLVSLLLAATN